MMPWWLWLTTIALGIIVAGLTELMRRRWEAHQDARLDGWDAWSIEHRVDCLRELKTETLERDGRRMRNGIMAWALMLWFIPLALVLNAQSSDDAQGAAENASRAITTVCDRSEVFRTDLESNKRRELDATVRERDRLADSITGSADALHTVPGWDALVPEVQRYLDNFWVVQLARSQQQLAAVNSDILRLQGELDDLVAAARAPCP